MRKLLISTLGFEEAFLIRFLLRNQPSPEDFILIVSPISSDPRLTKAYQEVEKFVARYMQGVKMERLEVPVERAHLAIASISKKIASLNASNAIVNLSGGMRMLLIEVLTAVRITFGDSADIEIELEDKRDLIKFKPSIMDLKVPSLKQLSIIKSMKELGGSATLSRISTNLKIPKSSVYKEIKKMERDGFVVRTEEGRFVLSDYGLSWAT